MALVWWLCSWLGALGFIRFMEVAKDGGPASRVTGFWFIEIKNLFSVALLRFDPGWREVFHSHAFESLSWVLGRGKLREEHRLGLVQHHKRSFKPVVTHRWTIHRVFSEGTTYVLSFRGRWSSTWSEYDEATGMITQLTHGRKSVGIPVQIGNPVTA